MSEIVGESTPYRIQQFYDSLPIVILENILLPLLDMAKNGLIQAIRDVEK